jgi:hypothetical protein
VGSAVKGDGEASNKCHQWNTGEGEAVRTIKAHVGRLIINRYAF